MGFELMFLYSFENIYLEHQIQNKLYLQVYLYKHLNPFHKCNSLSGTLITVFNSRKKFITPDIFLNLKVKCAICLRLKLYRKLREKKI